MSTYVSAFGVIHKKMDEESKKMWSNFDKTKPRFKEPDAFDRYMFGDKVRTKRRRPSIPLRSRVPNMPKGKGMGMTPVILGGALAGTGIGLYGLSQAGKKKDAGRKHL